MDIGKAIGVDVSPTDISVSHRVKSRGSGPRPIIAKFVRRDTKSRMMANKRKLKPSKNDGAASSPTASSASGPAASPTSGPAASSTSGPANSGSASGISCSTNLTSRPVFIYEDLTALRSRLLREVKKDPNIIKAYSSDGKIQCITKGERGKESKVTIENPDDLFKLGWSEDKLKATDLFIDI